MVRASCLPNMCCTVSLGSKCEVSITLCFCPNICKIVTPYRLSWTVWLVPLWQQCLKTLLCLVSALPGCRLAVFSTQYFLCLDLIGLPWDPYTNSNRKVCDVDVTVTFLGARTRNASMLCPSDQLHPPTTTQELLSVPDCANITHWLSANGFQTSPTKRLIWNLGISFHFNSTMVTLWSTSKASWGPDLHILARLQLCENEEWAMWRPIYLNTMLSY